MRERQPGRKQHRPKAVFIRSVARRRVVVEATEARPVRLVEIPFDEPPNAPAEVIDIGDIAAQIYVFEIGSDQVVEARLVPTSIDQHSVLSPGDEGVIECRVRRWREWRAEGRTRILPH